VNQTHENPGWFRSVHEWLVLKRPVTRYRVRYGLPILFHIGTSFTGDVPLDYSRPAHFDAIAVAFPDLRMVLAHLGHPWQGKTIAVIRRNVHVAAPGRQAGLTLERANAARSGTGQE
jgi:predicted TIM-barrel fold metal-dependent hydrolase